MEQNSIKPVNVLVRMQNRRQAPIKVDLYPKLIKTVDDIEMQIGEALHENDLM
jgi:hypothetical protein